MEDYISIFLYFLFFLGGFIVNKSNNKGIKKIYVLLFYLFFCFGYMTGGDWPGYEQDYEADDLRTTRPLIEPGYVLLFKSMSAVITDFFLSLAILKCIYLYTLIKILKKLLNKDWIMGLCISIPVITLTMLIDNPLRFMLALTMINIGVCFLLKKNYVFAIIFLLLSFMFHYTCSVATILFLFYLLREKVASLSEKFLLVAFIIICALSSSISFISSLWQNAVVVTSIFEGKAYDSYVVENNNTFFTVGSLLNALFAYIVITSKKLILKSNIEYGVTIFTFTVIYLFFSRIMMIVPTGFRLVYPFAVFYIVSLCYAFKKKAVRTICICIMSLALYKTLYINYAMIPYTNSIYYIVNGHKPLNERTDYNLKAYKARTGKEYDLPVAN